jgi:hypothetical protein
MRKVFEKKQPCFFVLFELYMLKVQTHVRQAKTGGLKAQFSALDLTIKASYAPNESRTVEELVQNDIPH